MVEMKAFYSENGLLIKAYDQGMDWQLLSNDEKQPERWFSKCLSSPDSWTPNESIKSAFESMFLDLDGEFKEENFVIC